MKISTRMTGQAIYNYATEAWDRELWEYYDEETGEAIPSHIAEDILAREDAHGAVTSAD
ncbi:hypothetical protein [Actinomadura sp. KC06]|uniref:hypothetical protein n=1 Tax=Actinomadura sp. KC06 TaxID=2530369 RepID=UPI00140535AB|nr:hypothetical protein [Actinomadura sp. KC06]